MSKSRTSNLTSVLETLSADVVNETKTSIFFDIQQNSVVYSTDGTSFLPFSAIVLCTIIESLMVCAVNMKNKRMLKSPYNVNIFHLAITDLLVSFMIFLTPGFIFHKLPSPLDGNLSGEIFCRVVSSHFLTFSTATTSVYITVALATERWYAVTRPLQYRAKFHTKRLICEVFIIWASSFCTNASLLFEVKYNPEKGAFERCEVTNITFFDPLAIKILGIVQFLLKFLFPFVVTCSLYYHVLRQTRKSRTMNCKIGNGMRHNISRMAALSTLVLVFCWLPNQVYYACFAFDLVTLNTPAYYTTIVIALINPCLNPFIFAFHSVQYRVGFRSLFCRASENDTQVGKIRLTRVSLSAHFSPILVRFFRRSHKEAS